MVALAVGLENFRPVQRVKRYRQQMPVGGTLGQRFEFRAKAFEVLR